VIAAALAVVIIIAALSAMALYMYRHTGDMADDAMISARYARNLAEGHGLRYNLAPADGPPVEGYSNFLWVLIISGGFYLQILPRLVTAYAGGFFALACCLALFFLVRRITGSLWKATASLLILASSLPFMLWAVQGLETVMFAAFATAAALFYRHDRPGPLTYVFALLVCLTRPDGLIVAASVLAGHLFSPERDHRRLARSAGIFFLLPFLCYTGFRLFYFGQLLPNVFYAKTGLGTGGLLAGLSYIRGFGAEHWPVALFFATGVVGLLRSKEFLLKSLPALMVCVLYVLFIVAVGGDFMPDYRFVMHVLPLVVTVAVIGGSALEEEIAKHGRVIVAALVLIALAWNIGLIEHYNREDSFRKGWHEKQAVWYGLASSWLLRHTTTSDTIACGDIGYIGYVTGVDRILDTNGLVDPYLASLPGAAGLSSDPHYVLDLKPDYIVVIIHYFENNAVIGHSAFDREVLTTKRFQKEYEKAVEVPGWRSEHRSMEDGKIRQSQLMFRIYKKRQVTNESNPVQTGLVPPCTDITPQIRL